MIYRFGNWDPRKYPAEELFKATVTILELGILEPRAQIMGGIAIFDFKNISMTHAWSVTPQVYCDISLLFFYAIKKFSYHNIFENFLYKIFFNKNFWKSILNFFRFYKFFQRF